MTSLFLGLYGVYFFLVASRGNSTTLMNMIAEDSRGYIPWLFAIIVIALLSENENTAALVKPFVALLILTFVLRNFPTISNEIQTIYAMRQG